MLSALRRLPVKRPFSRKINVSPRDVFEPESCPAAIRRFVARPGADPLAQALHVLFETYAGRVPALLPDRAPERIAELFGRGNLRKVFVACFREALARGRITASQAKVLFDFSVRFDPLCRDLGAGGAELVRAQPLAFDYATSIPTGLRVALLFRTNSVAPSARNQDLGDRLHSAFTAAGVPCRLALPETAAADLGPHDLVIIDEDSLFQKDPDKKQAQLVALRKIARRFVRLAPDPWGSAFWRSLETSGTLYDLIWTIAPSLRESWKERPFCVAPFPLGYGHVFDAAARRPTEAPISFCGAVEDYNIHRYYWLLFVLSKGLDVPITLTGHAYDGLPVEASLRIYLERLLRSRAGLSLTMRATGERIVVQRALDVIRGQRLLVQEYAPDMHHYFVPGEHYLEFRTPADLAVILDRLRDPGAYQTVLDEGRAFFRRRYSDELIVRHLLTYL